MNQLRCSSGVCVNTSWIWRNCRLLCLLSATKPIDDNNQRKDLNIEVWVRLSIIHAVGWFRRSSSVPRNIYTFKFLTPECGTANVDPLHSIHEWLTISSRYRCIMNSPNTNLFCAATLSMCWRLKKMEMANKQICVCAAKIVDSNLKPRVARQRIFFSTQILLIERRLNTYQNVL